MVKLSVRFEVRPNRIQTWKKALNDGAPAIFDHDNGTGEGNESGNNDALMARRYPHIGRLKVEWDFLEERSGPRL